MSYSAQTVREAYSLVVMEGHLSYGHVSRFLQVARRIRKN
jgi:hypothetical protein